jgi:hypothetical protein
MHTWIKKTCDICVRYEYYSAFKKEEIFPYAATKMNLEDMRPSEISQIWKDKYLTISIVCEI